MTDTQLGLLCTCGHARVEHSAFAPEECGTCNCSAYWPIRRACEHVAELKKELEAQRRDAARLDWLEKALPACEIWPKTIMFVHPKSSISFERASKFYKSNKPMGTTLREAIDAAIAGAQ